MAIELAPLPFDYEALAPHMSADTLRFHHDKHHATYVNNLNNLVADSELADATLEDIIKQVHGDTAKAGVFNNAAQVWNHDFFWNSLKPGGGGAPSGDLAGMIDASFGSYDGFRAAFLEKATKQFGSGWAWLVLEGDKLAVTSTGNADTPVAHGQTALLTCDVWEHAYYLDYQNRRPDYVNTFLDSLANWDHAAAQLSAA